MSQSFHEYKLIKKCDFVVNLCKEHEIEPLNSLKLENVPKFQFDNFLKLAENLIELLNEVEMTDCISYLVEDLTIINEELNDEKLALLLKKTCLIEANEPNCPKCGSRMVLRKNSKTNNEFYGCSKYPNCNGTANIGFSSKPVSRPNNQLNPQVQQNIKQSLTPAKKWYYAKSLVNQPSLKLTKDADLAVAMKSQQEWEFFVLDKRQTSASWINGLIPTEVIGNHIKSVLDAQGKKISGSSPEEILAKISTDQTNQAVEQPKNTTDFAGGKYDRYKIKPALLTKEQSDITDVFLSPKKQNIVINALAGTGKTTLLSHLSSFVNPGEKWQYLAFNVKNEQEGKKKLPREVPSLTTHKFIGSQIMNKNIQSNELRDKTFKMLGDDSILNIPYEVPKNKRFQLKKIVLKLVDLSKNNKVDPRNQKQALNEILETANSFDLDLDLSTPEAYDSEVDYAQIITSNVLTILKESLPELPYDNKGQAKPCTACNGTKQFNGQICNNCLGSGMIRSGIYGKSSDFNDVLWWPALYDHWKMPKMDVVLADEVQDFNKNQIKILEKLGKAGSRLVIVGDPNQAIYGFRGADSDAFNSLTEMLGKVGNGAVQKTLSVNFRCGSKIIDFVRESMSEDLPEIANLKSPQFKISPDGSKQPWHEGDVNMSMDYSSTLSMISKELRNGKLETPTTFLCRTNGPLVKTAFNLLKMGVPIKVIGNDIGKSLKDMIFSINKKINMSINEFNQELDHYYMDIAEKYSGKIEYSQKLTDITDIYDALSTIIDDNTNISDTDQLISTIDQYFDNKDESVSDVEKHSKVLLSSGHRSKGLEFERVIVIRPDLVPHPMASTPASHTQELNTKYVMLTRAKNELIICNDKNPRGKKEKN